MNEKQEIKAHQGRPLPRNLEAMEAEVELLTGYAEIAPILQSVST